MQLTTLLAETLKSGKIVISQNNKEAVEVSINEKRIDANVVDKEFVKEIFAGATGGVSSIRRGITLIEEVRQPQSMVKELVEDLRREGVTLTLSYKGDRVVTVGSEADSKLTRFVTGTKGIEINRPLKLAEMGLGLAQHFLLGFYEG